MGGDNRRTGNIRDDLSGERLGEAKAHSNGLAGNRETAECGGKPIKQLALFENENDFGKYRYSCFVTDLELPAKIVYDSYRGRADSENRIKELKYDFSIDDFVTNNFWATEACGNFIVMAYNFMSLFRHALINSNKKQFLKTIRYELISTPAYLEKTKDKHILYLARSLKTRQAFLSIWENKGFLTAIQH
jgi:hypothetical protein